MPESPSRYSTRTVACSSLTAGHLELFVLDDAGQLRHRWHWTDEDWSDWRDMPAPHTARITAIAAGSHSDRQQELIAIGADGSVHNRWNRLGEGKWSQWSDWQVLAPHQLNSEAWST